MQKFWQNFLTALMPLSYSLSRNDIKTWGLNPSAWFANLSEMITDSFLIQIKCGLNTPNTVLSSHHLLAKGSECFSHSQQRPSYEHVFRILWPGKQYTSSLFTQFQKILHTDWNFLISSWNAIKFAWELGFSSWACIMCWVSCNPFTICDHYLIHYLKPCQNILEK